MTAKDLIEKLSEVSPDTEIVSGMWNGRVDTYTVIDRVHVFPYDAIYADFFGTPGAFDDGLMKICSKVTMFAVGNAAELYPGSTLRGCEPLAVRHSLGVFHRFGCAL